MIFTLLTSGIKVEAAPAASLLIPIAGAIAMLGYMGVETIAQDVSSDSVSNVMGQFLLEYAAYKGTTIMDMFPVGSLTFSLGRLVCTNQAFLNILDFAQWLKTGEDEGPFIDKVLYAEENLTYDGVPMMRILGESAKVIGISNNNEYALYGYLATGTTSSANTAADFVNNERVCSGYWWLSEYYNNSKRHVVAYMLTNQAATNVGYKTLYPYYSGPMSFYGETGFSGGFNGTSNISSIEINGNTWRLGRSSYLESYFTFIDGDVKPVVSEVLDGIEVGEESIKLEGELKYPTTTEDGETIPATTDIVVGIPDLPLDQTGDTAAETIIDLVTDAPLDTTKYVDSGGVDEPTVPPVADMGLSGLETIFPFSLPFDIYYLVHSFRGEPVAPVVDLPLNVPGLGDYTLHIDLSAYNDVAEILRAVEILPVILGLIILTNRVVR